MTYIVAVDLLLAHFFHQAVDLVLRGDLVVCENLLVQGTRVLDDESHVSPNVAQIGESGGLVAIADDFIVAGGHGVINTAGGETRVGKLVPPAYIDDGIWQPELPDLIIHNLFLQARR